MKRGNSAGAIDALIEAQERMVYFYRPADLWSVMTRSVSVWQFSHKSLGLPWA